MSLTWTTPPTAFGSGSVDNRYVDTDIVERLRTKATVTCGCITCLDAADEIKRLRAEVLYWCNLANGNAAEIERLTSKDKP